MEILRVDRVRWRLDYIRPREVYVKLAVLNVTVA